jgi:4'-phosphopantetheinyl transferase
LLDKLFKGDRYELEYTNAKKPYIPGRTEHISISHSHDQLAILVSSLHSTGVDIELLRDKVLNIKHKFLNESELAFAGNDIEKLTTLWAAKEAIYKAYGLKEVEFSKNISVEKWKKDETNFYGSLSLPTFKRRYLLSREKLDNYILVYILSEV